MKTKLVITVKGGVVTGINSNVEVDCYLFDWDNITTGGHAAVEQGLTGFRYPVEVDPYACDLEAKDSLAAAKEYDDEYKKQMSLDGGAA